MKYGYTVKYNGEYYPAGTEVPEEEPVASKPVEEVLPKKKPGRPPKEKE